MKTYIIQNKGKGPINNIPVGDLVQISGNSSSTQAVGDFMPLTGTEPGKPVTGNIEISDNKFILSTETTGIHSDNGEGNASRVNAANDSVIIGVLNSDEAHDYGLIVSDNKVTISNRAGTTSPGLSGLLDYTGNIGDLDYIQKKYVDDKVNLEVSATQKGIVNNIALQELGGVDKLINGVRIGRGNSLTASNTVVGRSSLTANTGTYNDAFGAFVLTKNTSGTNNTGLGGYSLNNNTTGIWNTALGSSALANNTTGQRNIALASGLYHNKTGSHNSAIGVASGYANETGDYNTYVGRASGYDNGVGSYNIGVGAMAMTIIAGGYTNGGSTINMSNNVLIGSNVRGVDGMNDTLAIDNKGATVTQAANALIYGGFSVANRFVKINGSFSTNPANTPNADGDINFTKKVVAKADGTFGFATDIVPDLTITPTTVSRIRLTSDFTSNVVARANIPTFNLPVEAGKIYKIKVFGAYSTAALTTGGSMGFVLSSGATGTIFGSVKMNVVHTNTAAPEQVITAIDAVSTTIRSFATSTGVGTINIPEVIDGELIFECTASGVFNIQWGSEVANSNATLLKNTILEITEV